MERSTVQSTPSTEEDEWDTDGFVIPSLGIEDPDRITVPPMVDETKPCAVQLAGKEENIYLGPHGAPPSQLQAKQVDGNASSYKQRMKQKLKEADRRCSGAGHEDKVDNIRQLLGGGRLPVISAKSSRDWLDPHCHESEFDRRHLH